MDAKALVDPRAENLSEIKAETLAYTLGHVDSEALLDTLPHRLADVEVKKPADTLYDVEALALVDVVAYMVSMEKKKRHMLRRPERCEG